MEKSIQFIKRHQCDLQNIYSTKHRVDIFAQLSEEEIAKLCNKIQVIGDRRKTTNAIKDYHNIKNAMENNNNNDTKQNDSQLKDDCNIIKCEFDFTERNKITRGISDTSKSRPMVMAMFRKHRLDHSLVGLYFISVKAKRKTEQMGGDHDGHKTDDHDMNNRNVFSNLNWRLMNKLIQEQPLRACIFS